MHALIRVNTKHISTATYNCSEEGSRTKGRERNSDLVRERTRKRKSRKDKLKETTEKRKRETKLLSMKEAKEVGSKRNIKERMHGL